MACLGQGEPAFADWHLPRLLPIYRASLACAWTAESIAKQTDRCDAENAWVGGLLAPLGVLASAVHHADAGKWTANGKSNGTPTGHLPDGAAIARRLAAAWRLPSWLSAVVGHLGLPLDAARGLGAEPDHFLVVQLAVQLVEQAGCGMHLAVGGHREELALALGLASGALPKTIAKLQEVLPSLTPPADWKAPATMPLLADLLRLAAENGRMGRAAECERLHLEIDALENAVKQRRAEEDKRVGELKLRALAELAAGAGHEINNPLAVISGQAQYLMISEEAPARRKALQTIVGQTQRIHQTLTQLMQFARPPVPQKQQVDLGGLLSEVGGGLQSLADQRQVRLSCAELSDAVTLLVDPAQIRTAISGLLRNAVEAAPANGWASLRVECNPAHGLTMVVEDSGPGPTPTDREHLFDPFYSGRKAGRGRGLGLPVAWQLARQHGGDVRFEPASDGPTRFVLTLPAESIVDKSLPLHERNGCHAVAQ